MRWDGHRVSRRTPLRSQGPGAVDVVSQPADPALGRCRSLPAAIRSTQPALTGSPSSPDSSSVSLTDRRPIVVDESQLLTGDCIELLRHLHDHRATRFALVLVGGDGTWAVLSREPMLASRVYRRVRFRTADPNRRARRDPRLSPALRWRRQPADRRWSTTTSRTATCATGPPSPTARSGCSPRPAATAARRADRPQRLRSARRWRGPLTPRRSR